MGCWGMGLAQSDEFCEIYEKFMEEYDSGKSVSDISSDILMHYHEEFDDTDGIMHDVYFALAKAEWMCCEQSESILQRVGEIIESGANIEFYREMDASEKELKLRRKKLIEFYKSLQTPRKKSRKRYVNHEDIKKPFPSMDLGDCYAYKYDTGKRIIVILDWVCRSGWKNQVFCCILKNTFPSNEVKKINYLEQDVGHIGCYTGAEFLCKSNLQKVGNIKVPLDAEKQILGENVMLFGLKGDFKADFTSSFSLKLYELLESNEVFNLVNEAKTYNWMEKSEFELSLPISRDLLVELIQYVETELEECNHEYTHIKKFLLQKECDVEKVLEWLEWNGVSCDCEVFDLLHELY